MPYMSLTNLSLNESQASSSSSGPDSIALLVAGNAQGARL